MKGGGIGLDWAFITMNTVHNVRNIAEYTLRTMIEAWHIRNVLSHHVKRANTALDFGCGYGRLTFIFYDFANYIVGIDSDPKKIALARDAYKNLPQFRFDVFNGDIPFPDRFFDIILTNTVLQHIEDILPVVEELKRVSGGLVIIAEETDGEPRPGFYPRPITEYENLFEPFELIATYPRISYVNGEIVQRGAIMVFHAVEE